LRERHRYRQEGMVIRMDHKKRLLFWLFLICIMTGIIGCGNGQGPQSSQDTADVRQDSEDAETQTADEKETNANLQDTSETAGIAYETAQDSQIDFTVLKEENPDIFAWIHIPGTGIDDPVLQSDKADDFYESHDAFGEEDDIGAIYIELANLTSMCDFNTVLHGKTGADEDGLFAELYRFADPDFFAEHEQIYIYLDGNVLTYEIFAAYERENTSLIRTYDFTYLSGCEQFLTDLYATRDMRMNLREGWTDVSPYHFLITLTTQKENDGKQFIVVAALIKDAAGTIDRVVIE